MQAKNDTASAQPFQIMRQMQPIVKIVAITSTLVILSVGGGLAYWLLNQRQWCVQAVSNGGQEVTYSRGCLSPHRYKRWVRTASI